MPGLDLPIGLRQDEDDMGVDTVRDPGLVAVDHVFVAIPDRPRADRLKIGAAIRLGQCDSAPQLARREFRRPFQFLFLGAEALDGGRHDEVRVEDSGQRHPGMGDLLADLGVGGTGETQPAVFLVDNGAEKAELRHLADDLLGPDVVVFEFHDVRADVAFEELFERLQDEDVLFVDSGRIRHSFSPILAIGRRGARRCRAYGARILSWPC